MNGRDRLVTIADDEFLRAGWPSITRHFWRSKSRAAAAAQPRLLDRRDDVLRFQINERVPQRRSRRARGIRRIERIDPAKVLGREVHLRTEKGLHAIVAEIHLGARDLRGFRSVSTSSVSSAPCQS